MDNKDKSIKEMAKVIDDRLIEARGWLGSMNRGKGYWIAQKLVEHYQPKIPEDSVVLSREEYERLKSLPNKIIKYMDRHLGDGELSGNILRNCAKQFGLEIKE